MKTFRIGGKREHDDGQIRQFVGSNQAEIAPFLLTESNYDGQHCEKCKEILDIRAAVYHFVVVGRLFHHRGQWQDESPRGHVPALGQVAMLHPHLLVFLRLEVQIAEFQSINNLHLAPDGGEEEHKKHHYNTRKGDDFASF